jgi:hypothetical protein
LLLSGAPVFTGTSGRIVAYADKVQSAPRRQITYQPLQPLHPRQPNRPRPIHPRLRQAAAIFRSPFSLFRVILATLNEAQRLGAMGDQALRTGRHPADSGASGLSGPTILSFGGGFFFPARPKFQPAAQLPP